MKIFIFGTLFHVKESFTEDTMQSATVLKLDTCRLLLPAQGEWRSWPAMQGELPAELEDLMVLGDRPQDVADRPVVHAATATVQALFAPAPPTTDRPIEQLLVCDDAWSMSR